jgi:SAM-dependent methyltransferase
VERVEGSLYAAAPEELGRFDLILCGSVLVHLRDQLLALERLAALCRAGGLLISAEPYDRLAGLAPFPAARYRADREASVVFWLPSARTWRRMLWTAGFDDVRRHARLRLRAREGFSVPHVVLHARPPR